MKGYLRCFLSLRAYISGILSRRFNLETNQYQLQCFEFAAILVYPTPRCTDWAIIIQFGFSKMAACWLLPFNLLSSFRCDLGFCRCLTFLNLLQEPCLVQ